MIICNSFELISVTFGENADIGSRGTQLFSIPSTLSPESRCLNEMVQQSHPSYRNRVRPSFLEMSIIVYNIVIGQFNYSYTYLAIGIQVFKVVFIQCHNFFYDIMVQSIDHCGMLISQWYYIIIIRCTQSRFIHLLSRSSSSCTRHRIRFVNIINNILFRYLLCKCGFYD